MLTIQKVTDASFRKYGRILKDYDTTEIVKLLKETPLPEGVVYEPSVASLETKTVMDYFTNNVYGGLPVQVGYCNGHNKILNALEYHRSSEINIAGKDLILLIGMQQDINDDFTYDTAKVEAFLLPAGTAIEVYATTLHYAPCDASEEGFQCVVVLPKDTNLNLEKKIENAKGEDALLFARNKWLVAHKESGLEADGAFIGLIGENITL
ncbi:MAG TPA: DUF4867 family protein [Lachnospiraceae bacterium]|nr:DUF4867 family protein [Lachnospiraceae bacterium]